MTTGSHYRPAGFWKRVGAVIIDSIILSVINQVISLFTASVTGVSGAQLVKSIQESRSLFVIFDEPLFLVVNIVIPFTFTFIYFGYFYSSKGATLGKMALNLKVMDSQEEVYIGWGRAFIREVPVKMLSGAILMIGYLIALFRKDKRALHDLICGTQVIEKVEG